MSFDFRAELEGLCRGIPGIVAASVMGTDGIAIDHVEASDGTGVDTAALLVEYGGLLGQVRTSAQMLAAGPLDEVVVRSQRLCCILRMLSPDYFLAVVLRPGASAGRARHALRIRSSDIAGALV